MRPRISKRLRQLASNRECQTVSLAVVIATVCSSVLVPGMFFNADTVVKPPAYCFAPSVNNIQNNQFCTCPYTELTLTPQNSGMCQPTQCSPQGQKAHQLATRPKYCTCDEIGHMGITFLPSDTKFCPSSNPTGPTSMAISNVSFSSDFDTATVTLFNDVGVPTEMRYHLYKFNATDKAPVGNGVTSAGTAKAKVFTGFRSTFNAVGGAGVYRIDFASCPVNAHLTDITKDCGPISTVTVQYVPPVVKSSSSASQKVSSSTQSATPAVKTSSSVAKSSSSAKSLAAPAVKTSSSAVSFHGAAGTSSIPGEAQAHALGKAPFHILYSNDLTNILNTPGTYQKTHDVAAGIRASVDETAGTGIDAHMLQPGLGWVPLWPSKVLPISEHLAYLKDTGHKDLNAPLDDYVNKGGDVVKVFVDECRAKGIAPFISMRMNDAHHILIPTQWQPDPIKRLHDMAMFKFFADHTDAQLGTDISDQLFSPLFDWSHPEVREYKLSLIRELIENYDIDGFELDFERAPYYFKKSLPVAQRRAIMLDVITQVRAMLDRTTPAGKHRWLSVRIPGYVESFDDIGIDLPAWTSAGVDIINASSYNFTDQQMDISAIRKQIPTNVALYDEVHFVNSVVKKPDATPNFELRETTDSEFYTTANLAYTRGADGISVFNFVYYRYEPTVEGNNEPPFHIFSHLADRAWLSKQSQDYFAGEVWMRPAKAGRLPLNAPLTPGKTYPVTLDMVPPSGGWTHDGVLRLQSGDSLTDRKFTVTFNGTALTQIADTSSIFANPYGPILNVPNHFLAWKMPVTLPHAGSNTIEITPKDGSPVPIVFVDIALP